MKRHGFTLIELLIVVAIIAILAAIAVPNFLEAQTRAKVSRVQADMRTLATGLELYHVDHNKPMTCRTDLGGGLTGPSLISNELTKKKGNSWVSYRFKRLTTPIAYLTKVLPDAFALSGKSKTYQNPGVQSSNYDTFDYFDEFFDNRKTNANWRGASLTSGGSWRIASMGPDLIQAFGGAAVGDMPKNEFGVDYDASNGTLSIGDICRVGGVGGINNALPAIDRVHGVVNDPGLK